MLVTKIEAVTKTKFKVFLEEQFAFVLYKGELSRYKILEGGVVSQELVEEIKKEVLEKRAKLRAMHLLNQMERTEEQLRTKLRQNLYPEDVVEAAMQYVASFGYIGDSKYARRYIDMKQGMKSKREIAAQLRVKGIEEAEIRDAIEEFYEIYDEKKTIQRLLEKKRFCAETATEEEKKKMYAYLMRKGFRYGDISEVIQVSFWNT